MISPKVGPSCRRRHYGIAGQRYPVSDLLARNGKGDGYSRFLRIFGPHLRHSLSETGPLSFSLSSFLRIPSFVFLPVLCSAGPPLRRLVAPSGHPVQQAKKTGGPRVAAGDRPSPSCIVPSCLRVVFRCPDSTAGNAPVVPQSCLLYLRVRRAVMVDGDQHAGRDPARSVCTRTLCARCWPTPWPPGYQRQTPPGRPKLSPTPASSTGVLEDDLRRPRKQRHTAKRIFERLRDEYGVPRRIHHGQGAMQERVAVRTREMFVPLSPCAWDTPSATFARSWWSLAAWSRRAHCTSAGLGFHISSSPEPRPAAATGKKGKKKGARRLADPSATSRWAQLRQRGG